MACAPCQSTTECSVATGVASDPSSTSHERSEVGCRWRFRRCVRYMHASRFLLLSKSFCSFCSGGKKRRTKRHVAHRASPRHCHARTRCPAPCTRAHACRARSSRTHHACAPRQPCTCSHAATRAHVKKLGCRARVTGHWLTVGRLAAGTSGANALCNALATFAARETHASSTRCACHPPPTLLSSYAET